MKCYQCGAELMQNAKFCTKCGTTQQITTELIQKAIAGNEEAITDLYTRTYNSVYHTVHSLIRDEDTVLDIVQDSYIKGFQSLSTLETPENYKAWLKRIAINKSKDWLKKKKPVLFSEMESEDKEQPIDFKDDRREHLPEEVIEQQETTRLLNEILNNLSEDQRMVIGMFYYEQMSVKEIATILSISENTVKSRLNYGRNKIEIQVLELEKKGTKLYSLAPLPFLLLLFKNMDVQAAELPSKAILQEVISTASVNASGQAGAHIAKEIGKTAGRAFSGTAGKGVAIKVAAGIAALTLTGGTVAGVVHYNDVKTESYTENTVNVKWDKIQTICDTSTASLSAEFIVIDGDKEYSFFGDDITNFRAVEYGKAGFMADSKEGVYTMSPHTLIVPYTLTATVTSNGYALENKTFSKIAGYIVISNVEIEKDGELSFAETTAEVTPAFVSNMQAEERFNEITEDYDVTTVNFQ